jgi:hypothetical protein
MSSAHFTPSRSLNFKIRSRTGALYSIVALCCGHMAVRSLEMKSLLDYNHVMTGITLIAARLLVTEICLSTVFASGLLLCQTSPRKAKCLTLLAMLIGALLALATQYLSVPLLSQAIIGVTLGMALYHSFFGLIKLQTSSRFVPRLFALIAGSTVAVIIS